MRILWNMHRTRRCVFLVFLVSLGILTVCLWWDLTPHLLVLCSGMWVDECGVSGGVVRGQLELSMVLILIFWLCGDVYVVRKWRITDENQLSLLWLWRLTPLEVCERWQIRTPLEVW